VCGIAGFISFTNKFSPDDLSLMTDQISHRGPDAEGFFNDPYCSLGHKRLSIIDLSARANQPLYSENNRYVIVYNGEVYNFSEVGAHLKGTGLYKEHSSFKTSSDTEVILEAFAAYGPAFVNQLNGMFALAIYDRELHELYIFRDRLGIKPLIYYWDGENFAFGSEIKAITAIRGFKKEVNYEVLHDYLHLGFVPTPFSIYKNVFKLNAGCWLKVSRTGMEEFRYWNINTRISSQVTENKEQAMVKLSDLLTSSVQYQLKSDVPFGVFLSGGIDSSLITAQAVQLSSVKVNTFSIGFEENSHNESEYAKAVAQYLQTDHHEFIVSYKDAIQLIDSIFDAYDEPFADPSAIPTMLVSKLARGYVTVTLSGEGGDELFMGYGAYTWAKRLSNPLYKLMAYPASVVFSNINSRFKRIAHLLQYHDSFNIKSHIFSQEQYFFSSREIRDLLNPDYAVTSLVNKDQKINFNTILSEQINMGMPAIGTRKLSAMEQQAIFDMYYYLPDDLLTKVDRASMRFGLETRVPYLDHRVVEYALNLSPDLKYKNGISKYILKQILYQYIPEEFFKRPKQGFAIPLNKWLHNELSYLIEDNLNKKMVERFGIVSYENVEKLLYKFRNGQDYLYNRVWLLIILHKWLAKNF
jgi:asparagine synthase (glutamine-hydrolysing)